MRLAFAFVAMVVASSAMAAPCVSYGPEVVTLDGTVHDAAAYGPPGYGDTPRLDARERYQSLTLDTPLCVLQGDDDLNEGETGIRQVQIVTEKGRPVAREGQHIVLTGTLFHAHTGHHHTKVLVQVQEAYPEGE